MSQTRSEPDLRRAFTLIELLVVIAIITVLIGLLLPAVQKVRETAARMKCANNMKQIGLAIHNYENANKLLPSGGTQRNAAGSQPAIRGLSFHVHILPYLEQGALYNGFDLAAPWFDTPTTGQTWANKNKALMVKPISIYMCPSATSNRSVGSSESWPLNVELAYVSHYLGIMGPTGLIPGTATEYEFTKQGSSAQGGWAKQGVLGVNIQHQIMAVTDGTSNTFLIGEQSFTANDSGARAWTRGCDAASGYACVSTRNIASELNVTVYKSTLYNFNNVSFGSNHSAGANFLYTDGSVRIVAKTTPIDVLRSQASRNGGETLSLN